MPESVRPKGPARDSVASSPAQAAVNERQFRSQMKPVLRLVAISVLWLLPGVRSLPSQVHLAGAQLLSEAEGRSADSTVKQGWYDPRQHGGAILNVSLLVCTLGALATG